MHVRGCSFEQMHVKRVSMWWMLVLSVHSWEEPEVQRYLIATLAASLQPSTACWTCKDAAGNGVPSHRDLESSCEHANEFSVWINKLSVLKGGNAMLLCL